MIRGPQADLGSRRMVRGYSPSLRLSDLIEYSGDIGSGRSSKRASDSILKLQLLPPGGERQYCLSGNRGLSRNPSRVRVLSGGRVGPNPAFSDFRPDLRGGQSKGRLQGENVPIFAVFEVLASRGGKSNSLCGFWRKIKGREGAASSSGFLS